ncbi:hypothetical protein J0X19_08295 [Hymenobacter sp. BT186]|uniref:Uncharacterized protein n=1 Tax=Hymenobacter telluris TaxID=2816474 RepID=A0A939JAC2_9BACT|nr:hypothetical protein [Hymenobacter telluris]MBO0357941.1 hypothetical protein [Hymenobacter telluris]MBW3373968.1 hypothetical protein [Hymenobacter norwichensis]
MNILKACASAILLSGLGWGLFSCNQTPPAAETATAPPVPPDTTAAAPIPAPTVDTTNWMGYRTIKEGASDTTLLINDQRYRLLLTAEPDSSRPLLATWKQAGGVDTMRGVDARYRIVLRDATGKTVLDKQLRKPAFYSAASKDVVIGGVPRRPQLLAYAPPWQALVFAFDFWLDGSDVGEQCVLMLGLDGQVRELSNSNTFGGGGSDCMPRFSPKGQAMLTCNKLLLPGRKPIVLLKSKADLVMASFLSDTTLVTIYAYGENHYGYDADSSIQSMHFEEPPQMRNVPNAFVLNLRGQQLARFRYNGYTDELGYYVRRHYLPQTNTYYLLDEERGLRLIDKRSPTATREVRFRQMTRFKPPQKPREVRFQIQGIADNLEFYADQDHPERLRYRKVAVQ